MRSAVVVSLLGALSLAAPASVPGQPTTTAAPASAPAAADELMRTAQQLFQAIPRDPPTIEGNPITPEKVELGRMLFFEPRMSTSWMFSCNTCHNLATGGVDMQQTSVGHGWQKGPRNAPTVLNSVFNVAQFWDGRARDLREQATGPLLNPGEMGSTAERALETLNSMPEYAARFRRVFPEAPEAVSLENLAKAIEAFEATLLTPNAPFDRFLGGDAGALSAQQRRGLELFVEKGCVQCHNGINVGGGEFRRVGAVEPPGPRVLPPGDRGRAVVTSRAEDDYVFRVAPLRNVALTPPYFHSGQVWDLREAVTIMATSQLGQRLTDEEVGAIAEFLDALTGEQPRIAYPVLPTITGRTPSPEPFREVRAIEKPTPTDRPSPSDRPAQ